MGILTIAFDDGYKDTFNHCAAFLSKNGINATFAIPSSCTGKTLENREVVNHLDIRWLQSNEHEIAAHTHDHINLLELFNDSGKDAVTEQLKNPKNTFLKTFGITVDTFVFPFIDNNNTSYLRSLASRYYSSARISSENMFFNALPVKDRYAIMGTCITSAMTLSDLNAMADSVQAKDAWLIEVFHLVSDKNTMSAHKKQPYRFFTHIGIFQKHVKHILSSNIKTATMREVIQRNSSTK